MHVSADTFIGARAIGRLSGFRSAFDKRLKTAKTSNRARNWKRRMARIFISHSSRDDDAAARMKTWLASQGFETAFLDFDKTSGISPGADWEKTLYREVEQSQAVIIIQTPNWLASKWCFAEFTQARALGKAIFLVIETPTGDARYRPTSRPSICSAIARADSNGSRASWCGSRLMPKAASNGTPAARRFQVCWPSRKRTPRSISAATTTSAA